MGDETETETMPTAQRICVEIQIACQNQLIQEIGDLHPIVDIHPTFGTEERERRKVKAYAQIERSDAANAVLTRLPGIVERGQAGAMGPVLGDITNRDVISTAIRFAPQSEQ